MFTTSRRPFLRAATVAVTALLALAGSPVPPASAAVTTDTFVTVIGGGDDEIGWSTRQLFHAGNATITATRQTYGLEVVADGGTNDTTFTFRLYAPATEVLAPGTYLDRFAAWSTTTGCGSTVESRVVVSDVAIAEDGTVQRFAATYEHLCSYGNTHPVVGQIAFGQPAVSDVLVAATRSEWGSEYPGTAGRSMPVWVVNRGDAAIEVGTPALGGAHAADYSLVSNGCGVLAAGAMCTVTLGFTPSAGGQRDATLALDAAGAREVALSGRGVPGHSAIHVYSDVGDRVGQGGQFHIVPPARTVFASGDPSQVAFAAPAADGGPDWTFVLGAPSGKTLTPGTTYSTVAGARLDALRWNSRCPQDPYGDERIGSFTVVEATFRDGTGKLETFAATFVQRCKSSTQALRGWIAWRAAEPNVPPPAANAPVSGLRPWVGRDTVSLTWTNPASPTFTHVIVRGAEGSVPPASTSQGFEVYVGPGSSAGLRALFPGSSYSFSVWARDLHGSLSPVRTTTVRGTTILLSATPVTRYGQYSTVSAKLLETATRRAVTNTTVDFLVRKKGSLAWSFYGTAYTDAYGVAKVSQRLNATYEWQAMFDGASLHLGSYAGPVTTTVTYAVAATLSATSVRRYASVTVKGAVSPARPGQYVYLQRYSAGAWRNVATIRLTSASAYSYVFRPSSAGTWQYRVYKPGDASLAAGASPTRTLTVT